MATLRNDPAPLGRLLLLPGDGIGPEIMRECRRVLEWFARRQGISFETEEDLVGGAAYDRHGVPVTDEVMEKARAADAVLFGAVGGPKYDDLPFQAKPERALLRLRKELGLFANLRPAKVFDARVGWDEQGETEEGRRVKMGVKERFGNPPRAALSRCSTAG